MTFSITGSGLRDREFAKFTAIQGGSLVAVNVNVVSGLINIGSVSATVDSIYMQSGNVAITSGNVSITSGTVFVTSGNFTGSVYGTTAIDSALSSNPVFIGTKAEGSVPTEVAGGDAVAVWHDTFGRQVNKSTNLGLSAEDVNEVSPAILQSINYVQLDAVGSATSPHIGNWVNMSNYHTKTFYFEYSSGPTGGIVVEYQASPDMGSSIYTIGSKEFTDTDSNIYVTNEEHHEYIRFVTSQQSGGTLTATLTGRGGK